MPGDSYFFNNTVFRAGHLKKIRSEGLTHTQILYMQIAWKKTCAYTLPKVGSNGGSIDRAARIYVHSGFLDAQPQRGSGLG